MAGKKPWLWVIPSSRTLRMEAKQTNDICKSVRKINLRCYHERHDPPVKACLKDTSPENSIILYHGTNDLISKSTPEQISNIISLATSVKSDENCVFVSGLKSSTDKLIEGPKGPKWMKSPSVNVEQLIYLLLTIQTFTFKWPWYRSFSE